MLHGVVKKNENKLWKHITRKVSDIFLAFHGYASDFESVIIIVIAGLIIIDVKNSVRRVVEKRFYNFSVDLLTVMDY